MNKSVTTRSRGFGIVEVMVAMVIALLGMIVIFQVFALSEGINRTAVTGSDAQQNGAYSLYVLQEEIRQAGWGFNNSQALGCAALAYSSTVGGPPAALTPPAQMPAGAPAGAYLMAPVVINPGPANGSDTLEVNYGSQGLLVAPVSIGAPQGTSTDPFSVNNPYGFNLGDVVLAVDPTVPGNKCTLAQITKALPLSGAVPLPCVAASNCIVHDATATGYPYNFPGGSGVNYTAKGFVFNLGPTPTRDVFSVVNNQLTVTATLSSNAQQAVAGNIVQVKAQYGKDNGGVDPSLPGPHTANDGIVDIYDTVVPPNAAAWNQLLTVRIGVVARSAQPEKPSGAGPACDTTTTTPTWSGSTGSNPNPFNLTANANWQCYRYKVFETVIPVKNIIWTQG
jgi:type IV pilus assembly protein PilW